MIERKTISTVLLCLMISIGGCVAGLNVSQEDLDKKWHKLSGSELQSMFCNKTMSGSGRATWKSYWSSDCKTGRLMVGRDGMYKDEYRTVEVNNDQYCVTAAGDTDKKCYQLYEKDGKYLDIDKFGKQDSVTITDGIPSNIQESLDKFSSKSK